ncbi:MAG: DMT family transporter [Gammaproteobacteria bacterium]|nr:DMT family transporter [Gammaproteobacteria bacterium]
MNKSSRFAHLSDRGKGILMAIGGVFVLSPDSLLIRLTGLDDFTLLFYRGLFPVLSTSLVLWLYYRRRFLPALLAIGGAGVINAVLFSGINITFIGAIQRTSVANTLLFLSSAPIFAAVLSLLVLREKLRLGTWLIILCSLLSIVIIGWGSYGSNGIFGDLLALACAFLTACSAILLRYRKDIDLVPSIVLGSIFTACYAYTQAPDLFVSSTQLFYLVIIGFILVPIAFIALTIAPRYANSAEVQLVYLLESILGPFWVWLVIREIPSPNTMIGGSLLLLSIAWFVHHTIKEESTGDSIP